MTAALATGSASALCELLADHTLDAFAAVVGARAGRLGTLAGLTDAERYPFEFHAIWYPGADYSSDDFAAARKVSRAALRNADGMQRAIGALNAGKAVLARDGWDAHRLAGWLLRDITNGVAISYVKRRRADLDQMLRDLKLDQCSTQVALSRTTTSVASCMRKRYHEAAMRSVADGTLTADWLAEQAEAEFEHAAVVTIARMAYRRSGRDTATSGLRDEFPSLAQLHNIDAPPQSKCRRAVQVWLASAPADRAAAAVAALAGR